MNLNGGLRMSSGQEPAKGFNRAKKNVFYRYILGISLCFVLFMSGAFLDVQAEGTTSKVDEASVEVKEMDVAVQKGSNTDESLGEKELMEVYYEHSPDIKGVEIDMQIMELRHNQGVKELRRKEKSLNSSKKEEGVITEYLNLLLDTGILEERLKLGKLEKEQRKRALWNQFLTKVWQLRILEEQEALLQETILYYQEVYKVQKIREELGHSTYYDSMESLQQVNGYKNQLRALEVNKESLIKVLVIESGDEGLDIHDYQLRNIEQLPHLEFSLEAVWSGYEEHNVGHQMRAEEKEIRENVVAKAEELHKAKSVDLEGAKLDYQCWLFDMENQDKVMKNLITELFGQLEYSQSQYELACENVEVAKRQELDAIAAYDNNLLSQIEVKGTKLQRVKAISEKYTAMIAYYIMLEKLELIKDGILPLEES